jgi:hypothetical protein
MNAPRYEKPGGHPVMPLTPMPSPNTETLEEALLL